MEALSRVIAEFILFIGQQARVFWENLALLDFSWTQIITDIALVSIIFYFIFSLLQGSRAVHILIGLSMIGLMFFVSKAFQLVTLGWLLDKFVTVFLVAIPIIFQRELRMGLERLGHTKLFLSQKARLIDRMIMSIVESGSTMAQEKTGALIVVEGAIPLKEFIDTGIPLNAAISKELLLSVFNGHSPLHDGAVIIRDERIIAASCVLPHSFENDLPGLGTRHKAALGLAESTDAVIVVVSEEKGTISFAREGKLERNITPAKLKSLLTQSLESKKENGKRKRLGQRKKIQS